MTPPYAFHDRRKPLRQVLLVALSCLYAATLGLISCAQPPESARQYPLDQTLRLNHIQAKGTHNSYHIATNEVKVWDYTHAPLTEQLSQQGVRKFELDLWWNPQKQEMEVYHVPGFDPGTRCLRFRDCLTEIRTWSEGNPTHLPLFIFIEPKESEPEDGLEIHFQRIEKEILEIFAREKIFTPDDLRGSHPSLQAAVEKDGWPVLGDVRGKMLFVFLMGGKKRDAYTQKDPTQQGKLCFVTAEVNAPYAAIVKIDGPVGNEDKIQAAAKKGLIIRTRSDTPGDEPDPKRLEAALNSGAHLISTDIPVPQEGTSFVAEIPGGNPARCNPVSAPAVCTPKDLEDLPPTTNTTAP